MAIMVQLTPNGWDEVGRTEVIANNESPSFIKKFRVLYNFETVQTMKIIVVDVDKQHTDPKTVSVDRCVSASWRERAHSLRSPG